MTQRCCAPEADTRSCLNIVHTLEDKSIRFDDGRLAFVSVDRFRELVCAGKCCLVCADANSDLSTREHIIPDWILRTLNLHGRSITLPNSTLHRYGKYVIPCCSSCNALMGVNLEKPISEAFSSGFHSFEKFLLSSNGKLKLFAWMSFLFIKSHYKDLSLAHERDLRMRSGSIAKKLEYDWGDFHHIYCLARSPYAKASVHPDALGSLAIISILEELEREPFDFIDLTLARTIGIRIGEIGVIAVFGDGGAVLDQMNRKILQKITGPLGFAQFRELVANFACCSVHHKNPPRYASFPGMFGPETIAIACTSRDSHPEFENFEPRVLGSFMEGLLYESMKSVIDTPDFQANLREGAVTFLFDDEGNFVNLKGRPVSPSEPST